MIQTIRTLLVAPEEHVMSIRHTSFEVRVALAAGQTQQLSDSPLIDTSLHPRPLRYAPQASILAHLEHR